MSLHHTATALAVGLALAGPARADLLITEYLEGSSNNKAIELTNLGGAPLDLADYRLALYANGRTQAAGATSSLALSGSLAAGASLVIANPASNAVILAKADVTSGVMAFNGDDALVLYRGDEIVDSLGQLGVDPGSAWEADGVSTLNTTLRRKATITQGRRDADAAFSPADEYVALAQDTADGLGCAGEAACGAAPVSFVCPESDLTPIPAIQGSGERSPLLADGQYSGSDSLVTRGRVTQVVSGLYKGFFLQDVAGDGDPATSDGLFVYSTQVPAAVKPGVEVCVQGKVKEYYQMTELAAEELTVTDANPALPAAVDLLPEEGESLPHLLERHEGMRVRLTPQSDLRITRNFGYDYAAHRNNLVLSQGGPLFKATQRYPALSEQAVALAAANAANQLVVDTDQAAADGVIPWFPALDAEQGYLRLGERLDRLSGVLGYSYDRYRLLVDNQISPADLAVEAAWQRQAVPQLAEAGDLRVASFNVLNFFTTAVGGDANPTGTNRGATTVAEFELQRTKIVHALLRLNADVVGLMEIENNGYGDNSAIANLVAALNAEQDDPAQHYAFVASPDGQPIGSDAITVGLIYRPTRVQLDGGAQLLTMPTQQAEAEDGSGNPVAIHQGMRDALLQRFATERADAPLTVVVNHLKSKGSACFEDYPDYVSAEPLDLQGHCNALRVSAAKVLSQQLQNWPGDLLLIGDLNAYGLEDPLRVLTDYRAQAGERAIRTAAHTQLAGQPFEESGSAIEQGLGLINLNTRLHGTDTYSYSYEGEQGNLDHALANVSLADKVIGVEDWHINAAESNLFEYGSRYTGSLAKSDNPFSASDHDPVLVAIAYPQPATGVFNLTPSQLRGQEGQSLQLTVSREQGSQGAASVGYRLVPGSCDAADVALPAGPLRWADGESAPRTLTVTLLHDNLTEGEEQCQIALVDAQGATLGQAQSQLTIEDKPVATVAFGNLPTRVSESAGRLNVPVLRSGDLSQPLWVTVSLAGGSAKPWLDVLPLSRTRLYWPAGDASPRQVSLWVVDDWLPEGDETLQLRLTSVQGGQTAEPASATLLIEDNDDDWFARWWHRWFG